MKDESLVRPGRGLGRWGLGVGVLLLLLAVGLLWRSKQESKGGEVAVLPLPPRRLPPRGQPPPIS